MCKSPPCEGSSAVIIYHPKSPSPLCYLSPHWAIKFPPPLQQESCNSLLPSTTIPPTRISAGRNLFYRSPLQADSLQFSQWSQQEKRRSHTWALKSTACLLAGDSRPYCSFSHTHCRFPFFTYSPCCQNTTITDSSTHIPEQLKQPVTLVPTRGEARAGVGTHRPAVSLWPQMKRPLNHQTWFKVPCFGLQLVGW